MRMSSGPGGAGGGKYLILQIFLASCGRLLKLLPQKLQKLETFSTHFQNQNKNFSLMIIFTANSQTWGATSRKWGYLIGPENEILVLEC